MPDSTSPEDPSQDRLHDPLQWVVWNGTSGLLAVAALGRIDIGAQGRRAWLDQPFDMVGPFDLDELEARGCIAFAACLVMSRQRWQQDQPALRRQAHERRAAQRRQHEDQARFQSARGWRRAPGHPVDERQHRATLNLPADGRLEPAQIKTAYRRLAQRAHPDAGGSHEAFVRITQARNALLDRLA